MGPTLPALAIGAFVVVLGAVRYNRLVANRNAVDRAFSTIDVQLKLRCDLVPRVVEAVRGYMQHERGVLERLTSLRAQATGAAIDPAARVALDAQMGGLLARVFAVAEQYPELKASSSVTMLQRTLNEVEAQIAAARRTYNAAVTDYNTSIQVFPANVIAGAFRFAERPLFEAAAEDRGTPTASAPAG